MRVFLAGGSGAVGQALVPMLVEAGHYVVATTRSPARSGRLEALGAEPAVMDGLDRESVRQAVTAARPEAVIHQLTALSAKFDLKHFDRMFALTNRLRTQGTDHLLAAAQEAGAQQFLAQSYAGWNLERSGDRVKGESAPLDAHPAPGSEQTMAAIRHVEEAVTGASGLTGVVLRYGGFYGPGTGLAYGSDQLELVRQRKFPVVGTGAGIWSFIHIEDAARATLAALESRSTGIYHIVDDEPAPVREWLPYLADVIGAKPPRHLPAWLARYLIGDMGVSMMEHTCGASNALARRELDLDLRYPSWREGFRHGLGTATRLSARD
jgi:nucleoside-diphosphate-sugar epimerase